MKYVLIIFTFIYSLNAIEIELSSMELEELKNNSFIIKRDLENKTGFISFDVDKNINLVMDEIIDLKSYSTKINDVSKVDIYESFDHIVKAEIFIDNFFISFSNKVIHYISKNNYEVTWNLDSINSKNNYFSKMDGY